MKDISRRDFFKISGIGMAGITLAGSGLSLPGFSTGKAYACGRKSKNAWRFGVMADTQWRTGSNAGGEPASCATTIIDALNEQFIKQDCKFVIQVGDLVDVEVVSGVRTLPTRAAHAQALYDAGIGFFPVRGNHESTATAALEIPELFPQTLGQGANLFGAKNFQSPVMTATDTDASGERLKGLTYAFDYNNIRCVLIDQFVRADGTNYDGTSSYNNNAVDQVDWVDEVLGSVSEDRHAFVFAHKNLIGQNHKDVLFGSSLTENADARDNFISSLCSNGVRYCMGGHDHMHHRSTVKTSDGYSSVNQIICSSNSYKFYIPREGDDGRETPFSQELFTIGYYIVIIDGPRVTVEFYSSSHGQDYGDFSLVSPPESFTFYLRERIGYSLNGKEFQVLQGDSYTSVEDTYKGTTARILDGQNGNTETDYVTRSLVKNVNTGWSDSEDLEGGAGHVLTLWGMADNLSLYDESIEGLLPDGDESQECDAYTLSIKYDTKRTDHSRLTKGDFVLAALDEDNGTWANAVDLNYDSDDKVFVKGPWRSGYGLGTYGVDQSSSTVWAVINYDGDFVAKLLDTKEKNQSRRRRVRRHCAKRR